MSNKRSLSLLVLAAVAIAALLVAGCGNGGNSNTTGAASAPATTATTPPATTATTPPATRTTAPPRTTATRPAPAAGAAPSAAQVSRGRSLFASLACAGCHSISGARGIGPALNGVAGSRVMLTTGQSVTADTAYLTRSIDDPDAQIVQGYMRGIMSATIAPGSVNASDTSALVAYIQSLR